MERQTLADRILTYSDTVVAFAIVNGFAFVITLADPDIRCSIARVAIFVLILNLVFPLVSTGALCWLHGYEHRLRYGIRTDDDESEAGEGVVEQSVDPLVARFRRTTFAIRMSLIWIFAVLVLFGIYAATLDTACMEAYA